MVWSRARGRRGGNIKKEEVEGPKKKEEKWKDPRRRHRRGKDNELAEEAEEGEDNVTENIGKGRGRRGCK